MLLQPGRMVGAYEIVESLGRGGMGEVYRARDTHLPRFVAVKVVSAKLQSDPAAVERLKREARLASSLNHPAIVTIHDIGEVEGRPYIVMEFIDGEPLSARLVSGPMTEREAVEVAAQVADGLAAAHAADIVHRDLKPQNIMVTDGHRVKIVDFGLSKSMLRESGTDDPTQQLSEDLTKPYTVLGTIGYMAPEQLANRQTTFHADQFALGVVLYEMLTGKRAFRRDSEYETAAAILHGEPDRITEICPTLSPQLVRIIDRCLAKRPQDRYGSTKDLAQDLVDVRERLVSGLHAVPHPASQPPKPDAGPSVRPWSIGRRGLVAAVVLVLALGAAYYLSGRRSGPGIAPGAALQQVAVLPFACSGDDQAYCDGLMETLTSGLATLSAFDATLRVIPQQVAQRDLPADRVNPEMARGALGATVVITGAFERRAGGIRLTVTADDASHTAPSTWRRVLAWWNRRSQTTDIPDGQEDRWLRTLVTDTAGLLHVKATKDGVAAIDAGGTSVAGAFKAYALGRGYLRQLRPEAPDLANMTGELKTSIADSAVSSLVTAVRADQRFVLAHVALCEAYWRQYERTRSPQAVEQALASCRTALQLDERLAATHLTLAMIARGRGRYEEAVASARQAAALAPWSSPARLELAAGYQAQEQWDQADAVYQQAISDLPNDPIIYGDLCRFYTSRRLYEKAEPVCRRAASLTPDSTRVLNYLGATLLGNQANEEAAAKFKHSLEVRPTFAAASNLGYYYYQQGSFAEAAHAYQAAVALFSPAVPPATRIEVYRSLGASLYWTPNERAKSREAYDQVVRLVTTALAEKPKDPTTLLAQLADAYSLLGRKDEARAVLDELGRLDVKAMEVLYMAAGAREQSDDRTGALEWLKRALDAGYSREKAERSPFLADLRKDPRYASVVK